MSERHPLSISFVLGLLALVFEYEVAPSTWLTYDEASTEVLCAAVMRSDTSVVLHVRGQRFHVNFEVQEEINLRTNEKRRMRRTQASQYPWSLKQFPFPITLGSEPPRAVWQWLDCDTSEWVNYGESEQAALEASFAPDRVSCDVRINNKTYRVSSR